MEAVKNKLKMIGGKPTTEKDNGSDSEEEFSLNKERREERKRKVSVLYT